MVLEPLRVTGARRFSLAGLLLAVSVAAVLLAPLGTMAGDRRNVEVLLPGTAAAIPVGLIVAWVVMRRYPCVRWWARLLGMLLGAATASLATAMCLGHADARVLVGGTGALVVTAFGVRLCRVVWYEHRAAEEWKGSSALDSRRE